MLSTHLGASADLPPWAVIAACVLAATSLILLALELRRHARKSAAVLTSGLLAVAALLGAVLRPARVSARESPVGARVVDGLGRLPRAGDKVDLGHGATAEVIGISRRRVTRLRVKLVREESDGKDVAR